MERDYRKVSKNNGLKCQEKNNLHYRMYKCGRNWLFAGLFSLTVFGATTLTGHADEVTPVTQSNETATVSDKGTTASAVTLKSSSDSTGANTSSVASTVASDASQSNQNSQGVEASSTRGTQAATSATSQSVKTTNLGDASDTDIASAKQSAAKNYATTGQPQEITAVSADSTPANSEDITTASQLATAKTPSGDPVASVDGQSYYYSGTSTTLNIVKHYANGPLAGWSSSPSGAVPLTMPGVPVINASTIFAQFPVTKLSGGADAAAVLQSQGFGRAVEYLYNPQGDIVTQQLPVHVESVTYADGSAVDINHLKFSDTIPGRIQNDFQALPNTVYAFLTVDLEADGENYRTVKTVTIPIADQKPVINAAQGLTMTQRANSADITTLLGATATDAEDGPLDVSVTDTNLKQDTPGVYKVILSATDKNGVTTTTTSTVTVTAKPEIVIPVQYEDEATGATVHPETDAVTNYDTAGAINTYLVDGYTLTSEVLNMSDTSGKAKSVVADFTTNKLNYYSDLNGQGEVVATQSLNDLTSDKWAAMGINQSKAGTIYLGYGDSPKDIVSGYNTANSIGSIKFLYTKDATTTPTDDAQTKTAVPDAVSVTPDNYYDNTKTGTPTGGDDQFKTAVPDAISVTPDNYYDNTKTDTSTGEGVYVKKAVPEGVSVTWNEYYDNTKTNTPTGGPQVKTEVPTGTNTTVPDGNPGNGTGTSTGVDGGTATTAAGDTGSATNGGNGLTTNAAGDTSSQQSAGMVPTSEAGNGGASTIHGAVAGGTATGTINGNGLANGNGEATQNTLPQTNESSASTLVMLGVGMTIMEATLAYGVTRRKRHGSDHESLY
ncbi:hypothetical protein IWT140_00429 [Secundilactobacillus pentosiphilus]|uniref:Uncharacterized protein n=1 Tax=Secundilactobacillus pentosiphilus TaxID=1714682 RepID=A0A1Z5IN20_9LACO|nr:KxYKxGKxW signal peptide domain-containing protein [Secundilactobacillus pentosiphilus]GAX02831.1 hypothetical protein IWT140_00429 [Secundilactobacillus pentosiphilus]